MTQEKREAYLFWEGSDNCWYLTFDRTEVDDATPVRVKRAKASRLLSAREMKNLEGVILDYLDDLASDVCFEQSQGFWQDDNYPRAKPGFRRQLRRLLDEFVESNVWVVPSKHLKEDKK